MIRFRTKRLFFFFLWTLSTLAPVAYAEDADSDALMKAVASDAGRMSPTEQKMFKRSIQTTKESVARETLDVFYQDALEFYHRGKYDEALELLDNIYSVDPYYEDVGTLRETIRRLKTSHDIQSKRGILDDYMRKGNAARASGQNVKAISFWKQALLVNASYEPAKKKIREVNHTMAQKQYEAGYLYYHKGDLEQALDSWSNTIALDPSYKHRGLLTLMSKVQLLMRRDQAGRLTAKASQLYAEKDLPGALQTYEDLLVMEPRNEEARRMAAKIKFQLGQAAYKSAREALSQRYYAQAIKQWREAIRYGYETQRSQNGIEQAEQQVQSEREAKTASRIAKATAETSTTTAQAQAPAPPEAPPVAVNAEEAAAHYRQGMAAIRVKDYHRALEELDIAAQLDPTDEHIYVARERARQEWNTTSSSRSTAP